MEATIEPSLVMPSNGLGNFSLQTGQERNVQVPSSSAKVRISPSVRLIPHFKEFIAFLIFDVPEVRAVLMQHEGRLLRVYIVVNDYDFAVNEKIYDKEERLIDMFCNVDFDFHITSQRTAPNSEVILSR
jgi:hypothetical protein